MSIDVQQLADCLLGLKTYVIFGSQQAPRTFCLSGALGITGRKFDLQHQSWLEHRGEWRGRRPLIAIDDIAITQLAADEADGNGVSADELRDQITAAVAVHECAHVAECGVDYSQATAERQKLAAAIAAFSLAVDEHSPYPPMYFHGPTFVRSVIHLAHRANSLGHSFPTSFLFAGELYCIAEPHEFEYVLSTEPERLARESIFSINNFTQPLQFRRLWNQCIYNWLNQQSADSFGAQAARTLILSEERN